MLAGARCVRARRPAVRLRCVRTLVAGGGGARWDRRRTEGPVTLNQYNDAERAEWETLVHWSHDVGRSMARRARIDAGLGEDAAQEALLDLWQVLSGGVRVRHPRAWLRRALRNRFLKRLRRREARPAASLGSHEPPSAAASAEDTSCCAEVWRQFRTRVGRLPPPWREIVWLRRRRDVSRSKVVAWLQTWRDVRPDRCHQLLAEADTMLRALWSGVPPEARWPRRYIAAKNPWLTTPPPPFEGL